MNNYMKKEIYRGLCWFLATYITLTRILEILEYKDCYIPPLFRGILVILLVLCIIRFLKLENIERSNRSSDGEKVSQKLYKAILRGEHDGGKD